MERDVCKEYWQLIFQKIDVYFPIETQREEIGANLKIAEREQFIKTTKENF